MWQDIIAAAVFYLPFVFTIGFAILVFCIGLLCLISGTLLLFVLALYGIYCLLRDSGFLTRISEKMNFAWTYVNDNILHHFKESFILANPDQIPSKKAIYICSPHGLLGYSWFFHFSSCLSDWPSSSPRPLLAVHSALFRIPFAREILAANRCIEASEEEIHKALDTGHSVAIVIGGVEEMTYSGQEITKLILKKRKGYIRLAKQAGIPIVPLYAFGENEIFHEESFWIWKLLSKSFYDLTGLHFPLPSWKSIRYITSILKHPLETPIQTFVLNPIETQDKSEDIIRNECIQSLETFLKNKNIKAEIIA